jgi:membrane protein implicated in regulation of membrane protease activity
LRPFEIFDLRMNLIVFVLYSLLISFAVDHIHFIFYLNFVMSSWCLSDLPVSGQITAFAIYGMMMAWLLRLTFFSFVSRSRCNRETKIGVINCFSYHVL